MPDVTIEEWQLLSFFEVEPQLLDADVPWLYNTATYEVEQGPFSLKFSVAPGNYDVRIVLRHDGHLLYELNAILVKDIRYKADVNPEQLEILINDHETLGFRLKPHIELTHSKDEFH